LLELPAKLVRSLVVAVSPGHILVTWWGNTNFGDAFSSVLVATLSGKRVVDSRAVYNLARKPIFSVVGSIMEHASDQKRLHVWGSGFIEAPGMLQRRPEAVYAVRGPLTRRKLQEQGVACPEVYGDPALLCPWIYSSDKKKRYRLGLVPHYVDKENPIIRRLAADSGVTVINIEDGLLPVIEAINECESIAASSLHGLVVADAYGIPSTWLKLYDGIIGGEFKFLDYFASINKRMQPMGLTDSTRVDDITAAAQAASTVPDLEQLLRCCPFIRGGMTSLSQLSALKHEFVANAARYRNRN
jgi:pyruvyltransferase